MALSSPPASTTAIDMGKEIYTSSLSLLDSTVIDLTSYATPCRYRLFDCDQFANHSSFRVYEFTDISNVNYAAISYVWRGVPIDADSEAKDKLGTFAVKGAENADKISIDVLLQVCKAALRESVSYLWMDRIGIMQTSDEDKRWQIQQMHGIYKGCEICFVLPGGIRRLVDLNTPTSWIHRGWTLQEAMAPKRVKVIFTWTHGEKFASGGTGTLPRLKEITPFETAMCDLDSIFPSCIGHSTITTKGGQKFDHTTKLFGARDNHVFSLVAAMSESDPAMRAQAIWRSSLIRSSSRSVDMVFSIMGLFGVALDPAAFGADDRQGATIALARRLLERGECASWLGPSYFLPPAKTLSAFPIFPQTSVSGAAYVEIDGEDKELEKIMKERGQWLKGLPTGDMNDAGYFSFKARGVRLVHSPDQSYDPKKVYSEKVKNPEYGLTQIRDVDGIVWKPDEKGEDTIYPRQYAISLGTLQQYRWGSLGRMQDREAIRVLLVRDNGDGTVHRWSYARILGLFQPVIDEWPLIDLCLGGPTSR